MISKGQGAIEYLLIIAAAILVVAIVILAVTGALSGGQDQSNVSIIASDNSFNALKESSDNYVRIGMRYFVASNPIVQNIVGLWHLEDLEDSVGNNLGTPIGGPIKTTGIIGDAYEFDGTNYIDFGIPSTDLSGDLTIALWIYPTNLGTERQNPISKSPYGEFALTIEKVKSLSFYFGSTASLFTGWIGPNNDGALKMGVLKENEWQFIVVTRDVSSKELKSYYNGNPHSSLNGWETDPTQKQASIQIGKGYAGYFIGKIDEVVILDTVLTDEEVMYLFTGK